MWLIEFFKVKFDLQLKIKEECSSDHNILLQNFFHTLYSQLLCDLNPTYTVGLSVLEATLTPGKGSFPLGKEKRGFWHPRIRIPNLAFNRNRLWVIGHTNSLYRMLIVTILFKLGY
jgi:hypothetical protein